MGHRHSHYCVRSHPIAWSSQLAYAAGLVATDGCLVGARHVHFGSTDRDLVETFLNCVGRNDPIRRRKPSPGRSYRKPFYEVLFSDVELNRWLVSIGLTERKSLVLGELRTPEEFILPLVRGLLDGDGSVVTCVSRPAPAYPGYLYERLVTEFYSGSRAHLEWLRTELASHLGIRGSLQVSELRSTGFSSASRPLYCLVYAKWASMALLRALYRDADAPRLQRKWRVWNDYALRHGLTP
jgi:hypothetical protein